MLNNESTLSNNYCIVLSFNTNVLQLRDRQDKPALIIQLPPDSQQSDKTKLLMQPAYFKCVDSGCVVYFISNLICFGLSKSDKSKLKLP